MKRWIAGLLALLWMVASVPALAQEIVSDVPLDAESVRAIQIDLIGGGYLQAEEADGVMGPATIEAIRSAQAELGLPVDGCISDALSEALRQHVFPLHLEMRNSTVLEVQNALYRWGFLEDAPTGYYGASTQDAVASFQRFSIADFSAYMQGKSDATFATLAHPSDVVVDLPLYSEQTIACDGELSEDWYHFLLEEFEFPRITANANENSEGVKLIQKRLHALGYIYQGMEGDYDEITVLAMKYFQRRSGLPESGNCDEATSRALFAEDAVESDEYVMPYAAHVNRAKHRVNILRWDGSGYNERVKSFRCSCGAPATPTIKGTFYCIGPISEWYYMRSSNVWVRYAFQIKGNYFFHSVLFSHKGNKYPTSTSVANLGRNVSHGCIRLAVEDIKWMYNNCTAGMKVVIV